jgi:hypothetical protein
MESGTDNEDGGLAKVAGGVSATKDSMLGNSVIGREKEVHKRISARTRKQEFVLPSDPISINGSVTMSSFAAQATLWKSFCHTLSAVSAFRMRMRTIFVHYILLNTPNPDPGLDDVLIVGHAEHTVMLSGRST